MNPLLAVTALAVPPNVQALLDQVVYSWDHHDTLKFLLGGIVCFLIAGVAQRQERSGVIIAVLVMAGIGGVVSAGILGMLGDEARKGPIVIHGDKIVNGPC